MMTKEFWMWLSIAQTAVLIIDSIITRVAERRCRARAEQAILRNAEDCGLERQPGESLEGLHARCLQHRVHECATDLVAEVLRDVGRGERTVSGAPAPVAITLGLREGAPRGEA